MHINLLFANFLSSTLTFKYHTKLSYNY